MERERYAEANRLLAEVRRILATRPLVIEKRQALERYAAQLESALAIPWLPGSWTTRVIMSALLVLGLQQAWTGDYFATFIVWALLPLFSPYAMAEASFAMGKLIDRWNTTNPFRSSADERVGWAKRSETHRGA